MPDRQPVHIAVLTLCRAFERGIDTQPDDRVLAVILDGSDEPPASGFPTFLALVEFIQQHVPAVITVEGAYLEDVTDLHAALADVKSGSLLH
jgi:hypothetical protein